MAARPRAPHVRAPALHVGGWWDIFQQGTIDNFVSRNEHGGPGARGRQTLVIGPWAHEAYNGPKELGALSLPDNYGFDVLGLERRLYRHYLLGAQNGAEREPAVQYYTLGDVDDPKGPGNEWRTADGWPPFETARTPFYLADRGTLTNRPLVYQHCVRARAQDWAAHFQQQLPAVRKEPEHWPQLPDARQSSHHAKSRALRPALLKRADFARPA